MNDPLVLSNQPEHDLVALTKQPDLTWIARVDETDYHLLEVVIARDEGGSRIYSLLRDWQRTPMGRIAILEHLVGQNTERFKVLENELSQLRAARSRAELSARPGDMAQELAQLRTQCEQLKQDKAGLETVNRELFDELERRGGGHKWLKAPDAIQGIEPGRALVDGELECPECLALGELPKTPLLTKQALGAHRFKKHGVRAQPVANDTGDFCCANCGSSAFAPSVYDSTLCMNCAKAATRSLEVAA